MNKDINIITTKEIYRLLKAYKKNDENVKETLIKKSLYLVNWRVDTYFSKEKYNKEELISNGVVGLIKAIDKYKPYGKVDFYTFAINRIDNEIYAYIRKQKKNNKTRKKSD